MKYTKTMKNINYNTQLAIHNIRYVESKIDDKCSVVNQQHRIAIVFVVSGGIKGFWHCFIKLYVVHHMCYGEKPLAVLLRCFMYHILPIVFGLSFLHPAQTSLKPASVRFLMSPDPAIQGSFTQNSISIQEIDYFG